MLPQGIASLIVQFVRDVSPHPDDVPANAARKHGAIALIALMGDIGGAWLLRPDGSLWEIQWDSEEAPTPLPADRRTLALAAGASRYPWLSALLPAAPADAVPCKLCRGEGRIRPSADRSLFGFLCSECQALGWTASTIHAG
jgi:hypothetical protein